MKNKILFLIVFVSFFTPSVIAKEMDEVQDIGYKFYSNGAPTYYYFATYAEKKGDIFVDWEDNLYIVNDEGTYIYDSRGALISHMDERVQIPVKSDTAGNIFIVSQDKIKKLSPKKEVTSVFTMDKDVRLLCIDDKNSYYFLVPRKEYKTKEYQDEIKKIDERQRELIRPVKFQKSSEIEIIEKKILDYRNEQRERNWDLKELSRDYNDYWKKYEFETSATEKNRVKTKIDDIFNRTKNIQDRLRFIDKDTDDLNDRKKQIEEQREREIGEKNKENDEEIVHLAEEKVKLNKKMEDDLKMNYEIMVYTEDKFLVKDYPLPIPQDGLPLSSCQIIVSDKDGNFYGSDGKKIYIYDWEGNLIASFGKDTQRGGIKSVAQLAVDSQKNIYVMDFLNNQIVKFGLEKPSLNSLK